MRREQKTPGCDIIRVWDDGCPTCLGTGTYRVMAAGRLTVIACQCRRDRRIEYIETPAQRARRIDGEMAVAMQQWKET